MNSQTPFSISISLILAFAMALTSVFPLQAQQILDIRVRYDQAKELYEREAYQAARAAFAMTLKAPYLAESKYFLASSAIRADHEDGEKLMHDFVENYPKHLYAQRAYLDIASFYFSKGDYKSALKNYSKSKVYLTPELLFQKGYCEFHEKKYDEALITFEKLEGSFSSYENDAAYFKGFVFHLREDYEKSYSFLSEAFESEEYGIPAMELYVSTLYRNGKYQELIKLVDSELTPVDNGAVLNFLADSQYELEKYNSASKNYKALFKSFGAHRNVRNYFRAGYSYLKIENTDDATEYLKKSAVADDSVGAYASYYLGMIYSENKNLPFAITSFENTAKYPTVLREDALYHQARCMMELPDYQGAIEVLNIYKSEYETGRFVEPVNEMLGAAYAQTNDYDLSIQYIEDLDRLTPQLKRTYQRVSFLKGVTLFNDKKFELAAELFQKSLIHDEDAEIEQQTYYWMGETLSLLGQLDEALFYYQNVNHSPNSEVYQKAIYGRAYCYFNLKDYESAVQSFKQFESEYTNDLNQNYLADALLRMGDCHFALKQYQAGIDFYMKAENKGNKNKGHIYYQIGLLSRYMDKDVQAKQYFNKLIKEIPESSKADHAYFQMAQIDFEKGNAGQAIKTYHAFLIKYPTSSLVPFALLNQAVAYDNQGRFELSISNYRQILDRFPRHQTANSALLGLQDKNANGRFDEFDQYLLKYKQANPNSEALENIEFETARTNYYNQKYDQTIDGLEHFIKTYPKSSLIPEARYLIGEAYFRREQFDMSLANFQQLIGLTDFAKYPKVLYRLASIQSELGNLPQSNNYYYQLGKASRSSRNVINMHSGLMENHFTATVYDSAIYYGNRLLDNPRVDVLVGAQANLIIGKSEYALNNHEKALQNFLPLVGNSPDENGAEAYYYISKIYYDQAKYDRALESLFVLTNNFKNYENWLGEAYLLMADIYIETNELFQAKATLNSLIEHSALNDVKDKAASKLEEIEDAMGSNE